MDRAGLKISSGTGVPVIGVSRSAPSEGTLSEQQKEETRRGAVARSGTVLLVDDSHIFRDGLNKVLAQHSGLVVVGEASTGTTGTALQAKLRPDLTLMEANLPDLSGFAVTREIIKSNTLAKVILLSDSDHRGLVDDALRAGARGFVWKRALSGDLVRAAEIVLAGGFYVSPELCSGLLEDYRDSLVLGGATAKPRLTGREKDLLRLVAEGQRNKEIAEKLGISPKSVEAYRSRLMKKLGCRGAAELVRLAIREGIVTA
jgi:DNA-binding NarL/FixJ family response regulator